MILGHQFRKEDLMDCCNLPEPASAGTNRCRQCGAQGRKVHRETMENLLKPEARATIRDGAYFFDRTPDCDVVYFSNEEDSYFTKDALRVRVGIKESEPPTPICYCFGHTTESARKEILGTGHSTVADRITAEVQAGNCACEIKNPSGTCCLSEVNQVILRIQKELELDSVAETKGGKSS